MGGTSSTPLRTNQEPGRSPTKSRLVLAALQVLLQPRHDLDEIAGLAAVIELGFENAFPCVAAGPGRTGEAKDEFALGDAGGGPRLHGGGADLGPGNHVESDAETVDFLLEKEAEGFDGDVAAGQARAAGRQDHGDVVALQPGAGGAAGPPADPPRDGP